jgi:hypothetical protein
MALRELAFRPGTFFPTVRFVELAKSFLFRDVPG